MLRASPKFIIRPIETPIVEGWKGVVHVAAFYPLLKLQGYLIGY